MKRKNIITKCSFFIIVAVLLLGLSFVSFKADNKLEVSAQTGYRVTFDYNIETLSSNMPINDSMRASIENYSIDFDGGYLTNAEVRYPSNLFNAYYTYAWTYNGQVVDIESIQIIKDTTFELKWTPIKYSVNFRFPSDMKSKVTNLVEKIEFTIESPRIDLYEPKVPNYHFDGWYNGSVHYDLLYLPAGSNGDKELTARFTPIEYTINYNTSAKNVDNPKQYNVTDGEIILAEPSQDGHIFKGWYTDNNYTTQISKIDCLNGGNINIYPLWELEVYTVTYILPDGHSKQIEVEYGKKADLPKIDKNIFEIIITDVSRKNITQDTTINVKVVNIWYVYVIALLVVVGIVAAIIVVKKRRDNTHDNLRNKYQASATGKTLARVSIIEKVPASSNRVNSGKKSTSTKTKQTNYKAKNNSSTNNQIKMSNQTTVAKSTNTKTLATSTTKKDNKTSSSKSINSKTKNETLNKKRRD